jgi:peptide/nickel transport system substrate-binding protein
MKRFFVLLAIFLVLALVITGCSSGTTTTPAATVAPTTSSVSQPVVTTTAAGGTTTAVKPSVTTAPATSGATSSATAKPTATSGAKKYGGTLIDIEASGPGTPFGWPPDLAGGAGISGQIGMDQLMHEDRLGNITPNLATSFDIVSDPKNASITFHLRKGVKFHDGTDFNSQALKWNFDMIKKGVNSSVTAVWKSWEIVDDYTFRINFVNWQNTHIRNFTGISTVYVSPTAYEKNGIDWMRWNMVGTGAFKQVEYANDVRLVTRKFTDYWDQGKPYLDGVNLLYVTDQLTRLALFKSGGGDVMGVAPKDAADLQKAGYTINAYPAAAYVLIPDSVNANSPWANPKVRMAAEYAINKEAMSSAFGYGYQPPAYQLAPLGNKAIVPTITGRKFDVAKAKQLLGEAGFPNGFKTTIITSSTLDRDGATAIQAYFSAIGIQANIDFVEAARLNAVLTGTWTGILYHQLRPFPNFNADLALEFGSPQTTFYKSMKKPDGWQALLDATMTSEQQDAKLMQAAAQALYDDCTAIPIYYYSSLYATQNYVRDTGRGEMGSATQFRPYDAWLDK